MRIGVAALILALIASPAVAGEMNFTPKASDGQKVVFDHGKGTVNSHAAGSDVELKFLHMFTDKRAEFQMTVTKSTDENIDMDTSSVKVMYATAPLHVYEADELKKIVSGHARWTGFAVAFLGGVEQGLATRTARTDSYGRFGRSSYSSSTTTTYTDPYAAAEAREHTRENLDNVNAARDGVLARIDDTALQRTTMEDNDPYTWRIVVDAPKTLDGSCFKIWVTVGQDTHAFDFNVEK